jgi:hypothetical protein
MFCECVHSEIIIAIIYFMPHDLFLGRYLSINLVKSSRGHGFLESQDRKKEKVGFTSLRLCPSYKDEACSSNQMFLRY